MVWIALAMSIALAGRAEGSGTPSETTFSGGPPFLIPPVDAWVTAGFVAPATEWGSGHRGIDYGATPGTGVRAAADGIVAFAGPVGGMDAVTIRHAGGLESTYSDVAGITVAEGELVHEGQWIAEVERSHPGELLGLHFGVKLDGHYVDPQDYLGPLDVSGAIHLAPIHAGPYASAEAAAHGPGEPGCADPLRTGTERSTPNDNIVVLIAGINSTTTGGMDDPAFDLPARLGYPASATYFFSYAGMDGPRFHPPYDKQDTWTDLGDQAEQLARLLSAIGRSHPGADVDIIAHSQGGLIARLFLMKTRSWDPWTPRVDHLITFATPHAGTKLAGVAQDLNDDTFVGRAVVWGAAKFARSTEWFPDPTSAAVRAMDPDSQFMSTLAIEDVSFGTRVLALQALNDPIATADRATYPGKYNYNVGAPIEHDGFWDRMSGADRMLGHTEILESPAALDASYAFLRDAAPPCPRAADALSPVAGGALSFVYDHAADGFGWLEGKTLLRHLPGGMRVAAQVLVQADVPGHRDPDEGR